MLVAVKKAGCGLALARLRRTGCDMWQMEYQGQATLQQVFKVINFCTDTCFQSFSPLINCIIHHALLKFSHVATRRFHNSSISRIDGT